jgi:hypothetical protein
MKLDLGRYVMGLATIAFGVITLVWREYSVWHVNVPQGRALLYLIAAVEVVGGLAILWTKTARVGAIALVCLYLFIALTWVPQILAGPRIYNNWGNFFEQFSIVCGALIAYGMLSAGDGGQGATAARIGYVGFGVCVVSFTLEQLLYLKPTASFVPAWIPLGQMFWAVATTVAFALAAVALLTGISALLAARLTALMIAGFGLLVWLPGPFAAPQHVTSWAGNAQNTAILGATWVVADYLRSKRAAG